MKRLANLKNSSSDPSSSSPGKNAMHQKSKAKKATATKNSPYLAPYRPTTHTSEPPSRNDAQSFYSPPSPRTLDSTARSQSQRSLGDSNELQSMPVNGHKSIAPTVATNSDTVRSEAANSKAGTSGTAGGPSFNGAGGGAGSTFSSPAPSVRSTTTTLTTMQSGAPSALMDGHHHGHHHHNQVAASQNQQSTTFIHQFPTSPPASAIPPHVVAQASGGHPPTYSMATANNLLTDNASILTLASSSKRRRRNSLDTNASVRALAPSSIFGGSRESLPLSLLSGTLEGGTGAIHHGRSTVGGLASAERASVYSSSGVAPQLNSERNSFHGPKQGTAADGASVRSGLIGHGRNDSITGSIGGIATSPLASPREFVTHDRLSRRNSGWGEIGDEEETPSSREGVKGNGTEPEKAS